MITKLSYMILLISALCKESTKTAQRIYISITFRSKCERYPQRSKTSKAPLRKAIHCD